MMDARLVGDRAGFRDVDDRDADDRPIRRRGRFSPRWMRRRTALRSRRLK